MKIEPDTWLANIFGYDVSRIIITGEEDIDQRLLLTDAIQSRDRSFLYTKIPLKTPDLLQIFLDSGFHIVDINVVLERAPQFVSGSDDDRYCIIRDAKPADCRLVSKIAGICFTHSRFHQDPLIPRDIANTIKRKWIENYFKGARGEKLIVAEMQGKPVGFLAVTRIQEGSRTVRVIDLIGVHPALKRKRIGTRLINSFIHTSVNACDLLRVGTQIINTPSLHLYEQTGFRIADSAYILHAHVRQGNVIS